ncbi:hypothetical protein AZA_01647 [Nitrospirillum viridazoti Y2]|uniref:Uncharacterized protein n=1 Tax=Nitrospirillum amazonense TaxID=28077 RepID=A0A560HLI4_9PROT|nr:DUF6152 family protein [Nitrospirillum amazonense]EGY02636.1 hypothetical protein AZA_01647 [Nitrospirillum amazonense Y2]TWB46349.1 hypothetical protein FBZ92_15312 [Nitrospirillum amazonense]
MFGLSARMGATALFLGGLWATASSAHHSFNLYDMSKTAAVSGTLKEFRWGAPHSSMVLVYKDEKGETAEMLLVSGSPLAFAKQGFAPRDFHKGDKIELTYHPYVNGSPGGVLASLVMNGRTYSDTEAAGAASGGLGQ